jgi:hypothetical protein
MRCTFYQKLKASNNSIRQAPCLFARICLFYQQTFANKHSASRKPPKARSMQLKPMDYPNKELFPTRVRKQMFRPKEMFPSNSLVPTLNVGRAPPFFSRKKVEEKANTKCKTKSILYVKHNLASGHITQCGG